MSWRRGDGPPLIIGHRGASARELENTLAAFSAARQDRADGVELDVRLCATGEIVVFHDDDLRRLAGRGERIDALSFAALREHRLVGGHQVPTLDEVLEVLGDRMRVNVELKAGARGSGPLVERLCALLDRHRTGQRILVSSFDPVVLARVRRRAPRLPTGLLFHAGEPWPLRRAWAASVLRPFALHPQLKLVDGERMDAWRRRGYAVNTWTVDAPRDLLRLARLGVDAIITNDPAASRAVLAAG